ncbi:MAG TPA: hypothetical protein VGO40_07270 [Longimicrobium sp.]|jgi:hypothetical protein|nr:hypothetical protein [Longimicrobium sp.]
MKRRKETQPAPRPIPNRAPPFFVPYATDREQAEGVWQATVTFMKSQGFNVVEDERIYALGPYEHNGKQCVDVVGEKDRYTHEEILVILRTREWGPTLVCTANRGVARGEPIFAPGDAFALPFAKE